jgi:hypothetical protein
MVPTGDAKLAEYSSNFQARGVAQPADFDLSVQDMTRYTALHEPWMDSYNACKGKGGRSAALVAAKEAAKAALLPFARELYSRIQSSTNVADENKTLMNVTIRKTQPSPIPPPALAPLLTNVSVIGTVGRYRMTDAQFPLTRRRPKNARGATILSYAGQNPPPANDPGWKLEGQIGKAIFEVDFGNNVPPGTPCWVTCMWYSGRGQYSPAAKPVQVYLAVGPVTETA